MDAFHILCGPLRTTLNIFALEQNPLAFNQTLVLDYFSFLYISIVGFCKDVL